MRVCAYEGECTQSRNKANTEKANTEKANTER